MEEYASARAAPCRNGFSNSLGNNLPDIVSRFGSKKVAYYFNPSEVEYGLPPILYANLDLPGLSAKLVKEYFHGFSFLNW